MKSLKNFYDNYHKKNDNYAKVISDNNFTYFYITNWWQRGGMKRPKLKILDIGCGVGTLSLYFASKGNDVKGIDISERAIKIANNAKKVTKMKNVAFSSELLSKGKHEYDLAICSEVIEHVPDDSALLKDIYSNLKKDGALLLTTPLKENFLYKLGFYKRFDKEVGHLRRYTKSSIVKLLNNNGFETETVRLIEGPMRNLLYVTKLGFLIKFIRGPFIPLFHFIDNISLKIFGASNILVVAKRK